MKIKLYKCREKKEGCEIKYERWTSNIQRQAVCLNHKCLISKAERNRKKMEAKQAKHDRELTRERKLALKTLSEWLKEAQTACNNYIRLRDADKPCISCGKLICGKWDAGHYITVGSCSELRFHPMNIHKQCSWDCNKNKSGNIVEYRKGLVGRIGVENVEWLENHHHYYSWTIEDAKEIKKHFVELTRELKNETNTNL